MAQTQQNNQALQVLIAAIKNLSIGGGDDIRRNSSNKNSNNNTNPPNTTTTKGREVAVYQKWNKYCHLYGVVLCNKRGCGTSRKGSKDCLRKKDSHKDEATFCNNITYRMQQWIWVLQDTFIQLIIQENNMTQ